ncbi:hypothetical protein Ocin01_06698 [Orchesella cincta]|uniref:Uncharacterized protein n=1 Tax=Orchesella cincta TaxID=48709 RepID=A0A1D2N3X9_ORCCI|nr:hypothetical protein Ocin01_06698 [Orchesella cincta]
MMNMTNFDIGMFQPVYDDSTGNNAMSAPSGEMINDSLNQPDPPPYRIFVQSSFSGSGSGTDYTYANIPYFNMYGMDASTDSESRIEDVTEEDDNYRESRKQVETLFPANDPILSRKESTSCVLVDGLLEYDEDADVIQDDFDLDVDQQEILMQPNPQLKYSTSFHSVLDARRHHISKANQLRQKRTKSDFYINQLRLSSSFDQLCRKRVEETAKNSDVNESFAEVDVCNLQDSIHNRDFNIDEDPVTSSKSLFASVKNSLVACYQRFLSRNRVNCKSNSSSLEPNAAKDREALESEKNEFQRSSKNLSNYSEANCFHAIQDNGEICITQIYENGESMSGSSLTQNVEKSGIYLERNSFQDSLMMEIPNSMSHHSKTKDYESKNSDCNAIITQENGNVEEKSSDALTLQSSELPEYIGELSSEVPQSEETIPLLSKSSNSSQKVLTAEAKKSSKECPTNKQGILKRFFGMFRTKIGLLHEYYWSLTTKLLESQQTRVCKDKPYHRCSNSCFTGTIDSSSFTGSISFKSIKIRRGVDNCKKGNVGMFSSREKKRLGQSLILKLPPVVPLIAAAVAKVHQEASLNSSITGSSNVTDENPLEEICPPLEACIQSKDIDNSRNQQTVIAYPTKGILRQNNSKV